MSAASIRAGALLGYAWSPLRARTLARLQCHDPFGLIDPDNDAEELTAYGDVCDDILRRIVPGDAFAAVDVAAIPHAIFGALATASGMRPLASWFVSVDPLTDEIARIVADVAGGVR